MIVKDDRKKRNRIYRESNKQFVDKDSNKVISEEYVVERISYAKEPDFIKLYVTDISRLNNLAPATEKVLFAIVRSLNYKNIFIAYMPIKKIMAQDLGISINTINMAINKLKKKDILFSLPKYGKGMYLVDPNLFARGRWEDIKELRLTIDYDTKTGRKTLKSNIYNQLNARQLELDF